MVLKIHSRCNLACDICYMYELEDQSWKTRPTVISQETVAQVAQRLSDYAKAHLLDSVAVILHGGEPLLVGPARLRRICEEITHTLSPVTTVDLHMHTNGLLLHERHLEILKEFDVKVGVSVDGDQTANDRHRLDRKGRSSYEKVLRGIERLRAPEYLNLFQGILCTVDVENDPVTVHDALTRLQPPRIDYLLPHSTWDSPPPAGSSRSATPYADWLLRVFDRWLEQGRPMEVRTFDSVLSTLRGGPSLTEAMGLAPSDLAVVETDGAIEQADSLKAAYDGAPATGYDVFRHTFDDFARHPGVRARQSGLGGVSETCRRCPVVQSCGGGLYTHRYSTERGFDNPSVYCDDLRAFIEGVAERITDRTLSPAVHDIGELRLAQVELTHELLRRANDRASEDTDWARAWQTLLFLDGDARAGAELDVLLTHPYVRSALRRVWSEGPLSGWLAALTVAAGVRGRTEVTLAWDQRNRELHLPTLGTLRLPMSGRVEITTGPDGFTVRHADGTQRVRVGEADHGTWRPLRPQLSTQSPLPLADGPLIDDADPYRHCFPADVQDPLETADRELFGKRVQLAFELADEQLPGWRGDRNLLVPWVVTPLARGTGVQLGEHAPGALGIAVDAEPELVAQQLPRLGRRARFFALRETTDLTVPGRPAGRLLDEADDALATACRAPDDCFDAGPRAVALKEAHRALTALADEPERDLTETGAAFVGRLWADWQRWAQ
ncbi:radical SAM/SPASM protein FxsBH, inactivated beta-hydroxylase extension form [Streptomyces sp. HD]|uniref:radical SAM/SPASM protein FxsBH, inactivated beta-hydroxylase extension form n=1 Tax=Streptomyces sp. HD TaxID=3020892 RepID=UPI00232ED939|nr:radical SAM/SPASM protein FxsB, inactivated metallohydrolase extension form [Streptomyces sp. HD]MDC0766069.1 radical SAM/SPASM protein FxsB, inactivated metallohydrolase extension form [Streptomyces sp. HD]